MEPNSNTAIESGASVTIPSELTPLIHRVREIQPDAPVEKLIRAYEFASNAHAGIIRLSGAPYITHCLTVAEILAELRLDIPTLCAGLLHDVIEDTSITRERIETEFGAEVARLVEGVTKISTLGFGTREERHAENLRKMIIAMAQDIRVILIKLADRLHNMRTLQYLPKEKQTRIAQDTLDIYAPLAHRLGIGKIRWELEDLSLRFLNPEVYEGLQNQVNRKRQEREQIIEDNKRELQAKLIEMEITARIEGRSKHFYSIYQKMDTQHKTFEEIFDLAAIRVITESVKDCYAVLGIVHTLWTPIQGRFKDYIAMPKSNLYQSLHTTVWGSHGEPLEIQIRTQEMHRIAQDGIAAHWLYKESKILAKEQYEQKFGWLKQLLESQEETRDPKEFMENLKVDLFSAEVFVFTPKGKVKELPVGATPVDFAYEVHTEVGNHCVGAKLVGGESKKIIPLKYTLNTGDIVEIITSNTAHPSRDWLSFVKTSRARNKIAHFLKIAEAEQYTKTGKDEFARELKAMHANFQEVTKSEGFQKLCVDLGFPGADEIYIAIGSGKLSAKNLVHRLFPSEDRFSKSDSLPEMPVTRSQEGIIIKGLSHALVRFGKCCRPVAGDPIIGFITRGRGISVHKKDCQSIAPFLDDPKRRVEVSWDTGVIAKHFVPIKITGSDRPGLLRDVLDRISGAGINMSYAKAEQLSKGKAQILITLEISDARQLSELLKNIKTVAGVMEAGRTKRTK
jgi:GTP diphosphokinase / guanosine-3',5'-bis(diphosphate) 3'-diphosphatase